jgi:hypothetical protein
MDSDFDSLKLVGYTDTELIQYIESLPSLPKYSNVIPLSAKYLAKGYAGYEFEDAISAQKSASQLSIGVPHIHPIIQDDDGFYCIMEWILGEALDMAWLGLG